MIQTVKQKNGTKLLTTQCPITIDGQYFILEKAAPDLGQNNHDYLDL